MITPELTPSLAASQEEASVDPNLKYYFEWEYVKPRIDKLVGQWSGEITATENRRKERYIDVDVDKLRNEGKLAPDETFIPVRVIDTNIMREEPAYSAYLTQSRRLAIFEDKMDIGADTEKVAIEFTRGVKYKGWFRAFHRVGDGARMHGWDFMEVSFDPSKPHHVAYEHVGHDNLFFDRDIEEFQESEFVIRRRQATGSRLEKLVSEFGFDNAQVNIILRRDQATPKSFDERYNIYRLYFKYQGIVYVAWFCKDHGVTNWLKAPEPLKLGIYEQQMVDGELDPLTGLPAPTVQMVESNVDEYPIFPLVYKESEEPELTKKVGRCFLDGDWQEAQTALVSSYVNGCSRASHTMAAPETPDETESQLRQLDIPLESGVILSKPMKFFHQDYPDPSMLGGLQYLGSVNSASAGQVDFAASNRKDSRKSATELVQAQEEADTLKSTPITNYSDHIRCVFSFAWRIVQSQALQNKIPFIADPASGINNMELIARDYEVKPAGDIDVVERKEKIVQMMQDWPVISTTALAPKFLSDLMKLKYPDVGDQYSAILEAGDPMKATIAALATTLAGALQPEEYSALAPQQQMQLQQLQQQVAQLTGQNIQIVPTNTNESGTTIPGSNQAHQDQTGGA